LIKRCVDSDCIFIRIGLNFIEVLYG